MRFIIEQGYFAPTIKNPDGTTNKSGWFASNNGGLYAIIRVTEENQQIGSAEAVVDLNDIPKTIRKMMEDDKNDN